MIKGIQRQMVVVNTSESELFETAYFVLRRDIDQRSKGDMVAEANRLVSESLEHRGRGAHKREFSAVSFIAGVFVGAFVGALAAFCICLL